MVIHCLQGHNSVCCPEKRIEDCIYLFNIGTPLTKGRKPYTEGGRTSAAAWSGDSYIPSCAKTENRWGSGGGGYEEELNNCSVH